MTLRPNRGETRAMPSSSAVTLSPSPSRTAAPGIAVPLVASTTRIQAMSGATRTMGPRSTESSRSKRLENSRSPPSVCRDTAPFENPPSRNRPSGPETPASCCITGITPGTQESPLSRAPAIGCPSASTVWPLTERPGLSSTTGGTSEKRSKVAAVRLVLETMIAERSASDRVNEKPPDSSVISNPRGSAGRPAPRAPRSRASQTRAPARGAPSEVTRPVNRTAGRSSSSTASSSTVASRQVEASRSERA